MKTTYILSGIVGGLLWMAAGGGCGDDPPERRPDQPLASYGAGATRIALNVTGPEADSDKGQRCVAIWQQAGIGVDPAAPIRVTLFLRDGGNRLAGGVGIARRACATSRAPGVVDGSAGASRTRSPRRRPRSPA